MFKMPEGYRRPATEIEVYNCHGDSGNGIFVRKSPVDENLYLMCIASNGLGWEHVSVSVKSDWACSREPGRCPTWEEMDFVKGMFWGSEDVVMQLHPAESMYVNYHEHCLHLWRPSKEAIRNGATIPVPAPMLVGPRSDPGRHWRPLRWYERLLRRFAKCR